MDNNTELVRKFMKLQGLLHKKKFHSSMEKGPRRDSTRGQGRILAFLKMKDGVSTKDMSYVLGVRVSSLNEILSKLEKNGYVERVPSEEDKRVMLVKLTEKGREEGQEEGGETKGIFACLSEEEQATLGEYLDRINASLEEEMAEADPEAFNHAYKKRMEAFSRMFDEDDERLEHLKEMGPEAFAAAGFTPADFRHGRGRGCGHGHGYGHQSRRDCM